MSEPRISPKLSLELHWSRAQHTFSRGSISTLIWVTPTRTKSKRICVHCAAALSTWTSFIPRRSDAEHWQIWEIERNRPALGLTPPQRIRLQVERSRLYSTSELPPEKKGENQTS